MGGENIPEDSGGADEPLIHIDEDDLAVESGGDDPGGGEGQG